MAKNKNRKNLIRKVVSIVLLCSSQILLFWICYDSCYFFWNKYIHPVRRDMNWGILIQFLFYIFIIFSLLSSIIHVLNWKNKWLLTSFLSFLYSYLYWGNFSHAPYRSALVLFTLTFSLFVPSLIYSRFFKQDNLEKHQ